MCVYVPIGDPRHIVADYEKLLQARVTAFFDNERDDNPRETQKTGRPLKTIRQVLKGLLPFHSTTNISAATATTTTLQPHYYRYC